MSHAVALLLHLLAARSTPTNVSPLVGVWLTEADIDEALDRKIVSRPGIARVDLDRYWLELTENGAWLAEESRLALEVAA